MSLKSDKIPIEEWRTSNKHLKYTKLYSIKFLRTEITSDPSKLKKRIRAVRRVILCGSLRGLTSCLSSKPNRYTDTLFRRLEPKPYSNTILRTVSNREIIWELIMCIIQWIPTVKKLKFSV